MKPVHKLIAATFMLSGAVYAQTGGTGTILNDDSGPQFKQRNTAQTEPVGPARTTIDRRQPLPSTRTTTPQKGGDVKPRVLIGDYQQLGAASAGTAISEHTVANGVSRKLPRVLDVPGPIDAEHDAGTITAPHHAGGRRVGPASEVKAMGDVSTTRGMHVKAADANGPCLPPYLCPSVSGKVKSVEPVGRPPNAVSIRAVPEGGGAGSAPQARSRHDTSKPAVSNFR